MIRASGLYGRAVIDLDTAERIGRIDELIVDPYAPCVAGYVVAGRATLTGRKRIIMPVEIVEAVGPDAVTIRTVGRPVETTPYLDALPRLSELTGRKMVSFGGRLLGAVQDALIDERNGRIVGYPLEQSRSADWIESLFGFGSRRELPEYVRADAALRIGARLIVVPDDGIASASDGEDEAPRTRPTSTAISHGAAARELLASSHASDGYARDGHARDDLFGAPLSPSRDDDLLAHDGRSDDAQADEAWAEVDHEGDTGLLAAGTGRGRPARRQQAVKMH